LAPEQWGAVRVALGTAYPFAGELELAKQTDEEAWVYLARLPDSPLVRKLKARVCAELGRLLQYEAPRVAMGWLQHGLDSMAESDGLPEQAADLQLLVGSVRIALADYSAALEAIQHGLARLSEAPSQMRTAALINLGVIAYYQSDLEQAREYMQQA